MTHPNQDTKGTLTGSVERAVLTLGEATISQVVARVGHLVPASLAASYARRRVASHTREGKKRKPRTTKQSTEAGRREAVAAALRHLVLTGRLRRAGRGAYAPPAPKIFRPGQTA